MTRKKVVRWSVFLGSIALVVAVVLFVSGCGYPKVAIHCSRDPEGRLIADLKPDWRVLELGKIHFWLEGDDDWLWVLDEKKVPIRHIVYGVIPNGAIQVHPENNVPPRRIPIGHVLYVGVKYYFDNLMPASSSCAVKLQLTEDGGVTLLGDAFLSEGLVFPLRSDEPSPVENSIGAEPE